MTSEHPVGPEDEVIRRTPGGRRSGSRPAPRLRTIRTTQTGSWKSDLVVHDAPAGYRGVCREELRGYYEVVLGKVGRVRQGAIKRTGRLAHGHGRRQALIDAKWRGESPPRHVLEIPSELPDAPTRWLAPVVRGWAPEDDAHADGYVIAANRAPELGGWHEDVLFASLADQIRAVEAIEATGFDAGDVEDMCRRLEGEAKDRTKKMMVLCLECEARFEARGQIHFEPDAPEGEAEGEDVEDELGFLW